ncbi:hypothetical protein CKAN_00773400 [Cinnamomum micranthum f. kanehirae]|uniref:Uncharacterized protein n=1 Tax=Cinnamomum micranthum f. kanehirae TaxID=337451 RepID=A0A3S3M8W0_9MAGN|nr:hypothetical protein CKAN_00773400 [Cinnamomum micranthum f. kanehirae]
MYLLGFTIFEFKIKVPHATRLGPSPSPQARVPTAKPRVNHIILSSLSNRTNERTSETQKKEEPKTIQSLNKIACFLSATSTFPSLRIKTLDTTCLFLSFPFPLHSRFRSPLLCAAGEASLILRTPFALGFDLKNLT